MPMPATAMPSAVGAPADEPSADGGHHRHVAAGDGGADARRRTSRSRARSSCTRDVGSSPAEEHRADEQDRAAARTGRPPPENTPRPKYQAVVIENISAVAPLPVPKSSAIESKKAPKL